VSDSTTNAWHLYLVRAADGTLYTGITTDVERRVAEHESPQKRGAKYLRGRGPIELAYRACVGDRGTALKIERRIKRLSKSRKEQIVAERPEASRLFAMLTFEPPEPE